MTTIYEVYVSLEDTTDSDRTSLTRFFPTRAEAMRYAKHGDEHEPVSPEDGVIVTEHEVTEWLTKRRLYCALLNGEKWSAKQTEIYRREITPRQIEIDEDL